MCSAVRVWNTFAQHVQHRLFAGVQELMRTIVLTLSLFMVSALSTLPEAQACLNGVIMEQDEVVKNVRLAQRALGQGKNKKALSLLRADHFMADAHLVAKVREIKVVARMRLGKTKGAERFFRKRLKKDKDNPLLQTRLAEALHLRRGSDAIEAFQIMHALEERDLIPDAHGYAVLARLRKRNRDVAGHTRALSNCKRMAGKQAALCTRKG